MATRYNVVAAFPDEQRARRAVRKLTEVGVDQRHLRLVKPGHDDDPDRVAVLRAEMQDEVTEGWAGPSIGFMTPAQTKGAVNGVFLGLLIGGLIGVVVGVVWGLFGHGPPGPVARSLIVFLPFAIAGTTAGAIAGGALRPRAEASFDRTEPMDDARLAAERDTIVAVHVPDADTAERAQHVMEELGAERVDAVNADGTPLPPQSEHPRPADPPGRWWWPGRARG